MLVANHRGWVDHQVQAKSAVFMVCELYIGAKTYIIYIMRSNGYTQILNYILLITCLIMIFDDQKMKE